MRRILHIFLSFSLFIFVYGCGGHKGGGPALAPLSVDDEKGINTVAAVYESVTPPRLVAEWGGEGPGEDKFMGPIIDIAADGDGNIYVTDAGKNSVLKFSASGDFITAWETAGQGDGDVEKPAGIAVDGGGNVYVVCGGTSVRKYSNDGQFIKEWGGQGIGNGEFYDARDVAADAHGNVYVADSGNGRIQKFDPEGNFLMVIGAGGQAVGGLVRPGYLLVDAGGFIYVEDENNFIRKYDGGGNLASSWGGAGTEDGKFDGIGGIAMSPAGNILVADTGNGRLRKFSGDGAYISQWDVGDGASGGQVPAPAGLAVSPDGAIFAGDNADLTISKYTYSRSGAALIPTCNVTTTADSGAGSLRECMNYANTHAGTDTITFNTSLSGQTITLASGLPPLTDNATAIVNTTGGEVTVSGNRLDIHCFTINSGFNEIRGLSIGSCGADTTMCTCSGRAIVIAGESAVYNTVAGNYIGTNSSSSATMGNCAGIIISSATHNTIGGVNAGDRNIISSNFTAIMIGADDIMNGYKASANKIVGNYIGTNVQGTAALSNSDGIYFYQANDNIIGGSTPAERNVISGNWSHGIALVVVNGTIISGNYIGTNAQGTAAIGNGFSANDLDTKKGGIKMDLASNTRIGGTTEGERNLISGNANTDGKSYGIYMGTIGFADPFTNTVIGNYIGLNAAGTAAIGNDTGIAIKENTSFNYIIGGTSPGERNVISGNNADGIYLDQARRTKILGNYIGSNSSGTGAVPNKKNGIHISGTRNDDQTSDNVIGGTAEGEANLIAYNLGKGIYLDSGLAFQNKISGNRIFSNTGPGIDIINRANYDRLPPVISSVVKSDSKYFINGTFSCSYFPCTVELFRVDDTPSGVAADASGSGEGFEYITSTTLASGTSFSFSNISISSSGTKVSATLTDSKGNTSKFSINKSLGVVSTAHITISGCAFSPASIPNNWTTQSVLQCTVKDVLNDLSSVTVDLSAIGGAASAALSSDAGSNIRRLAAIKAPVTATPQAYTFVVSVSDTAGNTASANVKLTVTNVLPIISSCNFSPCSLAPSSTAVANLYCTASDVNGPISSVTANLSQFGGSTTAALTHVDGTYWQFTGINITGLAPKTYTIPVTAKDASSGAASYNASIGVTNVPPTVSGCAFTPDSIQSNGVATTSLQCTVTDPNNNISSVVINLLPIGGPASTSLTKSTGDTWRRTGITAAVGAYSSTYTLSVTVKDASGSTVYSSAALTLTPPSPAAPVVSACSFSPASVSSSGSTPITIQCTVKDINNDLVSVTADLSAFGDSVSTDIPNAGNNLRKRMGIYVPTTTAPNTYTIQVTATDATGFTGTANAKLVVTNVPPIINSCSFSPSTIPPDGVTETSLQCTAADINGPLSGVTVNLSQIGGPTAAALTNTSGSTWRLTGIKAAGIAPKTYSIPVTAKDSSSASASSNASITITNLPPAISGCALSPASIMANGASASVLQCTVTDANNNISAVTVNLSAIGGLASVALTKSTGNVWQKTGITAPLCASAGTFNLPVSAKDTSNLTASFSPEITVTAPPTAAPVVTACAFSPASVPANGTTVTAVQCTVKDVNCDLSSVNVNLSAIGGSSSAALARTTGDLWKLSGVTAAAATIPGVKSISVSASDAGGLTGSMNASLTVSNVAPVISSCSFSPSAIAPDGVTETILTCAASDVNNNLSTVTANLSGVGGSTVAMLANMGGNTWRLSGLRLNSVLPKAYSIAVTAKDSLGASGAKTASLTVTNMPPVISSCAFMPASIPANGTTLATLQCTVTDGNNNISSVTANLTSIGGLAATALTKPATGNVWRNTGIKALVGTVPGGYSMTVTAKDASAATATSAPSLAVTAP